MDIYICICKGVAQDCCALPQALFLALLFSLSRALTLPFAFSPLSLSLPSPPFPRSPRQNPDKHLCLQSAPLKLLAYEALSY